MNKYFVFDLDQTLYPKNSNIIKQIDLKITQFCQKLFGYDFDKADKLRQEYFLTYGTTLAGLMQVNQILPHEYLEFVHDVDYTELVYCPSLESSLLQIENKIIFTNGTFDHAKRVLKQRKIDHLFDDHHIYDICKGNYISKPQREAYDNFLKYYNITHENIIFFDDSLHNIESARSLGIESWHVHEGEIIDFCHKNQIISLLARDLIKIIKVGLT